MLKKGFHTNIVENIHRIRTELGDSRDLSIREFSIRIKKIDIKLAVLFISGLADENKLDNLSLELNKLINSNELYSDVNPTAQAALNFCSDRFKTLLLGSVKVMEGSDYDTLRSHVLSGNTVILMDKYGKFLILNTYGPKSRSITEPTSQTIVRGPKEAFTEKIEINISQLRKRIRDQSMKIENMNLGSVTKTNVAIIYLDQIAKKDIIDEVRSRLSRIEIDGLLESSYIEELIKDDPYSIFPTVLNSEKPDSVVAGLLEGKIAILVDGTPFALTVPALFTEFMQASEDYYHPFFIASMMRILRSVSFFLTLLIPSIYIALTTFHHEMIPTALLISIAAQREGVPFPAFVEAVLMEITFEVLREAGIRMPRAIGPAISIVGALVLGEAAVQAGIISAVIVIIVSLTAIASFAIPNYSMSNAIRALRFVLMMLSASFGLYGIYMGLIILLLHLSKLKSVGVPYLTPFAPRIANGNKDTFVRFPLWKMSNRPIATSKSKSPRIMDRPAMSGKKEEQEFN